MLGVAAYRGGSHHNDAGLLIELANLPWVWREWRGHAFCTAAARELAVAPGPMTCKRRNMVSICLLIKMVVVLPPPSKQTLKPQNRKTANKKWFVMCNKFTKSTLW